MTTTMKKKKKRKKTKEKEEEEEEAERKQRMASVVVVDRRQNGIEEGKGRKCERERRQGGDSITTGLPCSLCKFTLPNCHFRSVAFLSCVWGLMKLLMIDDVLAAAGHSRAKRTANEPAWLWRRPRPQPGMAQPTRARPSRAQSSAVSQPTNLELEFEVEFKVEVTAKVEVGRKFGGRVKQSSAAVTVLGQCSQRGGDRDRVGSELRCGRTLITSQGLRAEKWGGGRAGSAGASRTLRRTAGQKPDRDRQGCTRR
ncbi:hypothetical protein AXG93_4620s2280 [Marchantia polymorpha subsp. ruderalis]|uniref:Uncharacterized protein n=1 Tax=Marchantia polymorpha subsp. ruderalis TaxID=1480154 RepID=A0A176VYD8_MARPO|nr:hypothetical protein AXG93_4620s2280 [Marchantia polymorpha subsp. ruderalis]